MSKYLESCVFHAWKPDRSVEVLLPCLSMPFDRPAIHKRDIRVHCEVKLPECKTTGHFPILHTWLKIYDAVQQVDDLRAVEVHEEARKGPVHILGGSQGNIKKNIIEFLIIRIKLSEEGGFKTKALKMDFFRTIIKNYWQPLFVFWRNDWTQYIWL